MPVQELNLLSVLKLKFYVYLHKIYCNDFVQLNFNLLYSRRCTIHVSLDLSVAFDTMDFFLNRLKSVYGVCETAHGWFKSYLLDRHYRVCINSIFSEKHKLKCGVPQGSVLKARIYTMYTEPMRTLITKHQVSYHSYADDTQLYVQCDNDESQFNLQSKDEHCIADVCKWIKSNAL